MISATNFRLDSMLLKYYGYEIIFIMQALEFTKTSFSYQRMRNS